jgi:hypothetical protein
MAAQPILVWVNSYGPWSPEFRTPVETIGSDMYLNQVADAIVVFKNRVSDIYVSGGMYDAENLTECETVIPELKRRLAARGFARPTIHPDEGSVTSITIIRTFLETWHKSYSHHTPVFFTDEARYTTNAYIMEYFVKKLGLQFPPIDEVMIPVRRIDDHPDSSPEKQAEKLHKMKTLGVEEVERQRIQARKEHLTLR